MASNNNLRVLCCEKIKKMICNQKEIPISFIYISLQEAYGVDPYFVDRILQPYYDADIFHKKVVNNKVVVENLDYVEPKKEPAVPVSHEEAALILSAKPAGRSE